MTKKIQFGRSTKLAAVLWMATTCVYAAAARFPVTSDQVIAAMHDRQLPVEGLQVTMPTSITASIDHPSLNIESMTLLTPHNAQLKVSCRERGVCMAFYVSATWPAPSATVTLPPGLGHSSGEAGETKPARAASWSDLTVRAGSQATLFFEGDRLHILMRVVCLQGGVTGDKVRVATPDHKQTYTAEIISPTLLKGSL
jgi:hypothetical protein